jgi:hypothetical protein
MIFLLIPSQDAQGPKREQDTCWMLHEEGVQMYGVFSTIILAHPPHACQAFVVMDATNVTRDAICLHSTLCSSGIPGHAAYLNLDLSLRIYGFVKTGGNADRSKARCPRKRPAHAAPQYAA